MTKQIKTKYINKATRINQTATILRKTEKEDVCFSNFHKFFILFFDVFGCELNEILPTVGKHDTPILSYRKFTCNEALSKRMRLIKMLPWLNVLST